MVYGELNELVAWLFRRRLRFRVVDRSMEPSLAAGSHILVDASRAPMVGDIVVFRPPARWRSVGRPTVLVKRVEDRRGASLWVRSDNRLLDAVDSRQFGFVEEGDVFGPVSWTSRDSKCD